MPQQRRFVLIYSGELEGDVRQPAGAAIAGDNCGHYASDLAASLTRLGHEAEIWTVRRSGQSPLERGLGGAMIRRFPGQRDYLVPRMRPCWWVSDWVATATEQLAASAGADVTFVTFHWEAGLAGRLLAQRFGCELVHVPCVRSTAMQASFFSVAEMPTSDRCCPGEPARRKHEEADTLRRATALIARTTDEFDLLRAEAGLQYPPDAAPLVAHVPDGPDLGARFLAAVPASRHTPTDRALTSATLASLGTQEEPAVPQQSGRARRQPWQFEMELAKFSLAGRRAMF
jgi:hypothetical protein